MQVDDGSPNKVEAALRQAEKRSSVTGLCRLSEVSAIGLRDQ